ncbi:ParB/RepB/Spo0J family partition protein [Nocardia altamirensis]|uniref:ParB/RepB/Spo0J family partition protein n=1 Tax=Nocardia altamirensis TaxID=472158 RepID=UPI0008402824|nr:ParB/RepB/Spo0J family partition protein [Nocardia altamirensis]
MSQAKKGGLGRGLAALIPTGPATAPGLSSQAASVIGLDPIGPQPASAYLHRVPDPTDDDLASGGAVYREIPPEQIEPNPKQPRQVFEPEALNELVHSIKEFGLMQPIVVRRIEPGVDQYQLVMGERRWRASQEAGLAAIPAIVRETADESMLRDALLENIHRVQLNPLEEAAAYQQLLEEFGVTHEVLADRIGRSRSAVTNMIRLLKLPISVQRRVAAGVLSAGHARALLGLTAGVDAQEELAKRVVAEGLSVRSTEEAVILANQEVAPPPVDPSEPPTPQRKPIVMPGLQDVADRLSGSFDTRVIVSMGKRKGRIVVEFGSVDDLERIVNLMEQSKRDM